MSSIARRILIYTIAGLSAGVGAQAQDSAAAMEAAITAQPLDQALKLLGRKTGLQIVYVTDLVAGVYSRGAPAGLSAEQALTRLLEGTGLTYKFLTDHTVSIQRRRDESVQVPTPAVDEAQSETAVTREPQADGSSMAPRSQGSPSQPRFLLALIGSLFASSATAADEPVLEEVVVSAQKRNQDLQDVPVSMSALTSADIEKRGLSGFRDWANYVPGLTMFQGSSANRRAGPTSVIRGVSQTGGGQIHEVSAEATTSYMIGQVPIFSTDAGLGDLSRIEVLRGPQGTLFGIASMGGTIRFIPNEARTDRFAAKVGVGGAGIHNGGNTYDVNFMVNAPLIDNVLAVRLTAVHNHSDGWIDMITLPLSFTNSAQIRVNGFGEFDPRFGHGANIVKDSNSSDNTAARLSLTYTPTDRLSIKALTMWQRSEQDNKQLTDYNDQAPIPVVSWFTPLPQSFQFDITTLEAAYDLGFGSLEYSGGYFSDSRSETTDNTTQVTAFLNGTGANTARTTLNWDGAGGLPADTVWPSVSPFVFATRTAITTNELRLQGQDKRLGFGLFGSDFTFDYVVGGFDMTEKKSGTFVIADPSWNANRGPNTVPILTTGGLINGNEGYGKFRGQAVFGDVTLHLTRKLAVGAGVRRSRSSRESAGEGWGDVFTRAADGATVGTDVNAPGVPSSVGTIRGRFTTPRFTAQYKIDDERMLYFTGAKGQRMPSAFPNPTIFDSVTLNPACRPLASSLGVEDDALNGTQTDTVWSYDLGLKSLWLDRRLMVNLSGYYLKWTDLQRTVQLQAYDARCNLLIPANVGDVNIQGFELELAYSPFSNVTLNATFGLTDAKVAETVAGVNDSLGQPLQKGDSIENVAPWNDSVGLEYRFPLSALSSVLGEGAGGFARLDWRYVAERMGPNIGDRPSIRADPIRSQFISPSYELTDLRIGTTGSEWSASLYVSNLFDQTAVYESARLPQFPNLKITSINRPRTVGFTLEKTF